MLGIDLVRPLEDDWRDTIDAVARSRGWPSTHDVAALAACVGSLSAAYNDPRRARAGMRDGGPARLGFAFARDVPKGAGAVRELVATGALRGERVRVLDIGAGLGAMTWGLVRALEKAGARGVVDATWVDADAEALAVGAAVARARAGRGSIELRVTTIPGKLELVAWPSEPFDVVLAGHVLSELDVASPQNFRVERHATLLSSWLRDGVGPLGSLVLVEPALRERTRHLHRVRDELAARGATVFAPCLHSVPCPALARPSDWCHEDLPVDLPPWLVPVARAAGLRRQGLTFSYLVVRRDGLRLAGALSSRAGAGRLRVVSQPMLSKGKREVFLCGELESAGHAVVSRARVTRLDRDAAPANAEWKGVLRGDLLVVEPAPELERPRIGATTAVGVIRSGNVQSR